MLRKNHAFVEECSQGRLLSRTGTFTNSDHGWPLPRAGIAHNCGRVGVIQGRAIISIVIVVRGGSIAKRAPFMYLIYEGGLCLRSAAMDRRFHAQG